MQTTQSGVIIVTMRADKNAAESEKKATKALHPDLGGSDERFDPLNLLQKAERTVAARGRIEEESEQKDRKTENWHTFKTP